MTSHPASREFKAEVSTIDQGGETEESGLHRLYQKAANCLEYDDENMAQ